MFQLVHFFEFFELKIDTKQGTSNEKTHLYIFIIFIKKNQKRKTAELQIRVND